jgi:hypothetical protein
MLFSVSFVVCYSVTFAVGASVDKLPTPELVSVTYNDYSYDIPASTSKDPFTGQTIENPPQHIENRTLTLVISKKNINTSDGWFKYKIRMKGSFSNEWGIPFGCDFNPDSVLTTIVYPAISNGVSWLPLEGKADFQVQAEKWDRKWGEGLLPGTWTDVETVVAVSDWSNTKTVNLGSSGDGASSQLPSGQNPNFPPNSEGNQSEGVIAGFSLVECCLIVIVVVTVILLIGVILYYRRKTSLNLSEK